MKKLNFALLLALALSAVLISCGGGGGGGGGAAPATTDSSSTTTTSTYFGTKSPTDPKAVNDIVFSDGSATPYTSGLTLTAAQKNAAVAMIFYKGTECSNDGSTRTLGVGLKRSATAMKWCRYSSASDYANGYSTNITTIQCTPSGSAGSYTFSGDTDGSNNLAQIATFLASNGSTDDTETTANYPAFYWAKNYGTTNGCTGAYATGWYLPSIAELYQIYNMRTTIDAAIALCGLTNTFSSTWFWSASQSASLVNAACLLAFNSGDWSSLYNKNNGLTYVCAVRAF
ncbi:MAG: hypothetical protein IKK38_08815 [Spirochaetaceae bacterium]|nr:hypothetical protein [Spirochaetaceae bacterium]